jgi:hypothetical protein
MKHVSLTFMFYFKLLDVMEYSCNSQEKTYRNFQEPLCLQHKMENMKIMLVKALHQRFLTFCRPEATFALPCRLKSGKVK